MLNRCLSDEVTGFEILIVKSALGSLLGNRIGKRFRCGDFFIKANRLIGARAPGHHGLNRIGIQADLFIKLRLRIRIQFFHIGLHGFLIACREIFGVIKNPLKRLFIRSNNGSTGTGFNGQIAKDHTFFNRKRLNAFTRVLNHQA